jgi:hypothetical protein
VSAYSDSLPPEQRPAYFAATREAGRILAGILCKLQADAAAGDPDAIARCARMAAAREAADRRKAARTA